MREARAIVQHRDALIFGSVLSPMNEHYIRWYTPHLSREFEMLVFGDGAGLPLILFPTSYGRYWQNKEFGLVESIRWFVDTGKVTVYCPDSIDLESWYNRGIHPADRVRTHIAYENVIVGDVFDYARRRGGRHHVAVGGASFGGYHAANIAFKHPGAVNAMFSLSGAFDMSGFMGGYRDDNFYFNNPTDYMANCQDPWKYGHMGIFLGTGDWDICRSENFRMADILRSKGIGHWLDERRWCAHDWNWWREMLPTYVSRVV